MVEQVKEETSQIQHPGILRFVCDQMALISGFNQQPIRGLEVRFLTPDRDERLNLLHQTLVQGGLQGDVYLFNRTSQHRVSGEWLFRDPIALPVRTPGMNEEGRGEEWVIGLYVPHQEDKKLVNGYEGEMGAAALQAKVNKLMADFYADLNQINGRINCGDSLLVVSNKLCNLWQKEGMWLIDSRTLEELSSDLPAQEQRQLRIQKQEAQKYYEQEGARFMERYFWSLVETAAMLRRRDLTFASLEGDGRDPASVLRMWDGRFLMVDVTPLIAVSHNEELRKSVFQINNSRCGFPGIFSSKHNPLFSVEELARLDEWARFRDEGDQNIAIMGLDSTDVDLPEQKVWSSCGRLLAGRYGHIPQRQHRLPLVGWGEFHLHHIIPRGAGYRALIALELMESGIIGSLSVRELLLLLRGTRIRDLISDRKACLFEERKEVLGVIAKNVLKMDRVVNSPYNLTVLCPSCHELIHPDMKRMGTILGFMAAVDKGELDQQLNSLQGQEELGQELIGGDFRANGVYSAQQGWIKLRQARRAVMAVGSPYWDPTTTDSLLDAARLATDRWLEGEIEEELKAGMADDLTQAKRDQLARKILSGQGIQPEIHRQTEKLIRFQSWLEASNGTNNES